MMNDCTTEYQKLPPGWDCRVDQKSGKCYYFNYLTRAMQLEDPRIRYKQLQNEKCSTESIPMQPLHGSPYHVYPTSNFPAIKAFQGPNPSLQSVSASPLLSAKGQIQVEMSPILRQSNPQTPRMGNLPRRQTIQETSFSNNIDTDAVVVKINNMFPTASEDHIRLLLKKYYNREAVVISALQVEKHPVTMPGPYATPPSQRHLYHSNSAFQMTPPLRRLDTISRTGSPIPCGRPSSAGGMSVMFYGSPRIDSSSGGPLSTAGSSSGGIEYRSSPKPHSSPKMKLRYLKNVFPKADETLLLDILANSDNNVQKASEKLITMGYTKRDVAPPPKLSSHGENRQKLCGNKSEAEEKIIPLHPKAMTNEEKQQMKIRLQERYKDIAEKIISMALESVNYSEDRALQILQIVQQEDETKARKESVADEANKVAETIVEESQPGTESNRQSTSSSKKSQASEAPSKLIKSSQPSSPTSPLSPSGKLQKIKDSSKDQKKTSLKDNKVGEDVIKISPDEVDDDGKAKVIVFHVAEFSSAEVMNTHSNELATKDKTEPSISSCSENSSPDADERKTIKVKNLRHRDKSNSLKNSPRGSTEEDVDSFTKPEFKSIVGRIPVKGHNSGLAKGPDDRLLLADYVTWNGANPDISTGRKNVSVGSDPNLRGERLNIARGHNPELCKGPNGSLTKGSIYSQLNCSLTTNVKCN